MVCLKQKTLWVAYSGGVDSHVLLHALRHLGLPLKVIHVHHNMSPHADKWQQHCAAVCADAGVEFVCEKITAEKDKDNSLEAFLREQRYAIFAKHMAENDVLVTAHHQDDQAETLMLQLMRGAGTRGLASMPVKKKFANGFLIRPLLNYTREQIVEYAVANKLRWLEDESNTNENFSRNFLRQKIMPLLKSHWPAATETLSRSAQHCADMEEFVNEVVGDQYQKATLSLTALRCESVIKQRFILRSWLQYHNVIMPSTVKLQQMLQDFLQAAKDKNPRLEWEDNVVLRYQDQLYLKKANHSPANEILNWNLEQPLQINHLGILNATKNIGKGLRDNLQNISIRFRQGGEKIKLPGRSFHHDLKKLFQELKIPTWERGHIPLLFVGEELAMVVGYFIAENYLASPDEAGWEINLQTE